MTALTKDRLYTFSLGFMAGVAITFWLVRVVYTKDADGLTWLALPLAACNLWYATR